MDDEERNLEEQKRNELLETVNILKEYAWQGNLKQDEMFDFVRKRFDQMAPVTAVRINEVLEQIVSNFMSDDPDCRKKGNGFEQGFITGLRNFDQATGGGIYPGLSVFAYSNNAYARNMSQNYFVAGLAVRLAKKNNRVVYLSSYFKEAKALAGFRDSLNIPREVFCIKFDPLIYMDNIVEEIKNKENPPAVIAVDNGIRLRRDARELNAVSLESEIPVLAVTPCEEVEGRHYLFPEFELNASNIYRFKKFSKTGQKLDAVRVASGRQRFGQKHVVMWFVHFPGTYRFEQMSGRAPSTSDLE